MGPCPRLAVLAICEIDVCDPSAVEADAPASCRYMRYDEGFLERRTSSNAWSLQYYGDHIVHFDGPAAAARKRHVVERGASADRVRATNVIRCGRASVEPPVPHPRNFRKCFAFERKRGAYR